MGPSLEHYRRIECLMQQSRRLHVANTVQFFPHNMEFPMISLSDRLTIALGKITSTLSEPAFQRDNPSIQFNNETMMAINIVASILQRVAQKPPAPQALRKLVPPPMAPPPQVPPTPSIPTPSGTVLPLRVIPTVRPDVQILIPTINPPAPRVLRKVKRHPHTIVKHNAKGLHQLPSLLVTNTKLLHIYNNITGKKETIRSLLNNQTKHTTWSQASSNEYGCLMNGNNAGIVGTQTMEPIKLENIPAQSAITYGSMVCDH